MQLFFSLFVVPIFFSRNPKIERAKKKHGTWDQKAVFVGPKEKKRERQATDEKKKKKKTRNPLAAFGVRTTNILGFLSQLLGFKIGEWGMSQNLGLGVGWRGRISRAFYWRHKFVRPRTLSKTNSKRSVVQSVSYYISFLIFIRKKYIRAPLKVFVSLCCFEIDPICWFDAV